MLPIIYQDEHLIVVHKPSGLLVHRSKIDKYETRFLLQSLRDQIGKKVYPVHRLDKPTSGLIVFALDSDCAQLMTEQFTNKQVKKTYLAVVRGYVDNQIIDYPLKEQLDKMTDSLAQQNKEAQGAITKLSKIKHIELPIPVGRYQQARFSLVRLEPHTGRKHQLRRHLAHIRHPILGDTTHGDGTQNKFARAHLSLHRLALIANTIEFTHPYTTEALALKSNIDSDLGAAFTMFDIGV